MVDYLNLPIGDQVPEVLNAIIEIPLGETNKYEYDKKLHVFRLDRNLFSPVHYPGTTASFRRRSARMAIRLTCWFSSTRRVSRAA